MGIIYQILMIGGGIVGIRPKLEEDDVLSRSNTDTLRYVCCFIVLFSHIMVEGANLYLGYLHFVAVTIFFILSGYGLTCAYLKDYKTFLKRHPYRICKLVVIELTVVLIQNLIKMPVNRGGVYWFGVLAVFYAVFGLAAIGHLTNEQFIVREIITFSIFTLTMVFFTYFKLGNNVTKYVGSKLSLYIFAVHGVFINLSEMLFGDINISFVILGSVIVAIGIYYFVRILIWDHLNI